MKLTDEQKGVIVSRMLDYVAHMDTTGDSKTYSRNKLAKDAKVNIAYIDAMISGMANGKYVFNNTIIKDVYFNRIAKFVGYELDNKYWKTFETEQYLDIENDFIEAKTGATVKSVIGATGSGKTYAIQKMRDKYPASTYIITCANDFNLRDFIRFIAVEIGVSVSDDMSQSRIRRAIETKLKMMYEYDTKPILIFDEAENLKLAAWGRVKALYDNLKGMCAFMVLGTPNWYRRIKNMSDTEKGIAPQIYSRFLAGNKTTFLGDIDSNEISNMCKEVGVINQYVINRICKTVTNYRDLNDTLVSLQRSAEIEGREIDLELYKREYERLTAI
ncbi:ATP-binding protein [Gabonibacter chumensis]|uniref:ATP-binding protein n=1 Tax=Gabonibacter chumensis TaxID=2972474 RepID=UPI002573D587|nr:ATP-binding protein [Gabonibacter chumensis]MCR9011982.1 ATP-binding protein [Gabonibacter chumensis]